MSPDNQLPKRTYFIGGPPRVGKSLLAYRLAEKIKGHVTPTDAIRSAAKKACNDKTSNLFAINRHESLPEKEWLRQHFEEPRLVTETQNKESKAVWPSLVSFCNSFADDDAIHIIEGVALLPSMIAKMKHRPEHIVFVGNTNENHFKAMIDHAKLYPQRDWMTAMGYSDEKIRAMASFVLEMSQYFKQEAEKYNFEYREIEDNNFDSSLNRIIGYLVN